MGFSIGGLISGLLPAVGSFFGGPLGGAIGSAVGGAIAPRPSQVGPMGATAAVPTRALATQGFSGQLTREGLPRTQFSATQARGRSPFPTTQAAFISPPSVEPAVARVPSIIGRFAPAIPGGIAEILMRARQNTGRAVSSSKIRDSARVCGLETTASMFGISVQDVCEIVIARRRRRRGISASDLRRTRSTIRKINSMRKSLKKLGGR